MQNFNAKIKKKTTFSNQRLAQFLAFLLTFLSDRRPPKSVIIRSGEEELNARPCERK